MGICMVEIENETFVPSPELGIKGAVYNFMNQHLFVGTLSRKALIA